MTPLAKIRSVLKGVCPEVALDVYKGDADTYLVYNPVTESADMFVDDTPSTEITYLQVHLYTPRGSNYSSLKQSIKTALLEGGFSYPTVEFDTVEEETSKRHVCFETNIESEV